MGGRESWLPLPAPPVETLFSEVESYRVGAHMSNFMDFEVLSHTYSCIFPAALDEAAHFTGARLGDLTRPPPLWVRYIWTMPLPNPTYRGPANVQFGGDFKDNHSTKYFFIRLRHFLTSLHINANV